MDSTSIQQPSDTGRTASRLPAGSMLTLPNGIRVPHPHAESNLPGVLDVRSDGTTAIEETLIGAQRPIPDPVRLTESQRSANLIGVVQTASAPGR